MVCFYGFIGFVTFWSSLVFLLYSIFKFFWNYGLGKALGFGVHWKKNEDDWAIITGCTDGIGLEYTRQMAKLNYNLLLISRNAEKLESVKQELLKDFPNTGQIQTLVYDFNSVDKYHEIETEVNKLPRIDVLINNVGISYHHPEFFTQYDWGIHESIIKVNIYSCSKMMHMVLPKMESQKRGIIINLSSYSGIFPVPLLATYSATKAYIDFLSYSLAVEYRNKGIIIQSVQPIFVATKMSKIKRPSLKYPTPEQCVNSALKGVGISSRSYGFWFHACQVFITKLLVFILGNDKLSQITFNRMNLLRSKHYKKLEKRE